MPCGAARDTKRKPNLIRHLIQPQQLGETDRLHPEDWLNDIKWFPAAEAVDKIAYEDISKLMLVGMKKIRDAGL